MLKLMKFVLQMHQVRRRRRIVEQPPASLLLEQVRILDFKN